MLDKKVAKQQYLQTKLPMGIIQIKCLPKNKSCLIKAANLPGKINALKFQLKSRAFVNKKLQADWNEFGEAAFSIEVLDELEYEKDGNKANYNEDLKELLSLWQEKIISQGEALY